MSKPTQGASGSRTRKAAAGDGIPGTNTTAAEKAGDAVGSTDGAANAAAPTSSGSSEASHRDEGQETPPAGDEPTASAPATGYPDDFEVTARPSGFEVTHLHVRALRNGHRRAGRRWPAAGTEVPIDDFTEAQVEALVADPVLSVTPVAQVEAE